MCPLRYGAGEMLVQVEVGPAPEPESGHHPSAPVTVLLSPAVLEYLHIRTEPVYQLRATDGGLEIGPVLGLLLGNRNHWYDHGYLHREPERVVDVYARTGGLICAFSPRNVSLRDGCAHGLYYDPQTRRWNFATLPLPMVLHRRSFHHAPGVLERLRYATGAMVFNSRRFDKHELYEILRPDPGFVRHLPETVRVTEAEAVFDLLNRHPKVILKPSDLSRGRGILFVEQGPAGYRLLDCRVAGQMKATDLSGEQLAAFLAREICDRRYLSQQCIDLARIHGAPFDIRIVMQRNRQGRWRCTGIECRLAGEGLQVTNLAYGGRALLMHEAVAEAFNGELDPEVAEGTVVDLSQRFCRQMDATGETFAEFGIDMALDQSGAVWFIEANVLPTFKGFKEIAPDVYRRILAAPLLYANAVAGFGEAKPAPVEKGGNEELGLDG